MDEKEKPFDTVSIVLLMIIAGVSDGADLATAALFPFLVIGQITYFANSFLISPITYAVIQGWFIIKTHGKRASLSSFTSFIPVLGGLGNIVNIPGSELITTGIAIWMANHPKAATLTMVAGAAIATRSAGAAAANASERGASGGGAAAAKAATAEKREVGAAALKREEVSELGQTAAEGAKKEISPEALGEEKPPFEKLQEELTQKIPANQKRETQEEAPEASNENQRNNNVIDLSQKKKQNQEPGQNVQLNGNEINLAA